MSMNWDFYEKRMESEQETQFRCAYCGISGHLASECHQIANVRLAQLEDNVMALQENWKHRWFGEFIRFLVYALAIAAAYKLWEAIFP